MRPSALFAALLLAVLPFVASAQQDASPSGRPPVAEPAPRGSTQDAPQPAPEPKTRIEVLPGDPRPEIRIEPIGEPLTSEEVHDQYRRLSDTAGSVYQGLDSNPEILAARAELEAALARVKQLEMKTATDIVRKQQEIDELKKRIEAQRRLVDNDFATANELIPLEAELSAKSAELVYMLGQPVAIGKGEKLKRLESLQYVPALAGDVRLLHLGGESEPRPSIEEGAPELLREILASPITIVFEGSPLPEVMEFLTGQYELNVNLDVVVRTIPIDTNLKNVTVAQAFSALSDAYDLAFVVRDYGVFVTNRVNAESVPGPSIPEGVPYRKIARQRPIAFTPAPPKPMEPFKYDGAGVPLERVEVIREEDRIVPPSGDMPPPVEAPRRP